ncbi:MAG TPA: Mov34/MPN/PAD-1 family protein, partial [Longimicrobiales bacterium]|nr:Mov34/MPN/PAD-1 family protein [Longimicrobiales bacterium]
MIRLSRELLSAMAGEARARYPEECVGALVGRPAPEGDGVREVVRVAVAGNERATRRERRYLLGPARLLEIDEQARRD